MKGVPLIVLTVQLPRVSHLVLSAGNFLLQSDFRTGTHPAFAYQQPPLGSDTQCQRSVQSEGRQIERLQFHRTVDKCISADLEI